MCLYPYLCLRVSAVPADAIDNLWEGWNDVAEGFGIDKDECNEIFTVLQETLDMPKKPLASITEQLFEVYDTDNVRGPAGVWRSLLLFVFVQLFDSLSVTPPPFFPSTSHPSRTNSTTHLK